MEMDLRNIYIQVISPSEMVPPWREAVILSGVEGRRSDDIQRHYGGPSTDVQGEHRSQI